MLHQRSILPRVEGWWSDLRRFPDSAIASRKRRQLRVLAGAVMVVLVAAAIGVFSGSGGGSESSAPCGIVASGQKLCGQDLAAYCRFAAGSLDQRTVQACAAVGVNVVPR